MHTLFDFIRFFAKENPQKTALEGINRKALLYKDLLAQAEKTHLFLVLADLGRNDPVSIILPEGPEMTAAFVSAACSVTTAPLNAGYSLDEFLFYFTDLQIKTLITSRDFCPAACQAANQLGIPILFLSYSQDDKAGRFDLRWDASPQKNSHSALAEPDDNLLVCHTSGTTARPKIVPLSHRNVCVSAANIIRSLELTPYDRCLNVMPLFHIHGSIICAISTLVSGGTIIAAPRFNAPSFLSWMEETQPTWYSAAPSIHQSVLNHAIKHPQVQKSHTLRLIRSSAAAMPPSVMAEIEELFKVPFIEGYGLSETAHLLTSNFLPPFKRKPGSVGIAAGPEVAVMDINSNCLLPPGHIGEIVARGPNVMRGYLNNPEANQQAFSAGWFRTGDQGYMDHDGYFYINGRIKEIINRGGEKIAPREIDEALLSLPHIQEAVTFAIPSRNLGEEVAAAVVINDSKITQKQIKYWLEEKLAHFKVPAHILIVDSLPKGPTGKIQRIKLAEYFGLDRLEQENPPEHIFPRSPLEASLAAIWEEVLHLSEIGVNQTFISLGGDSILAGDIALLIQERLQVKLSFADLLDATTIADQAVLVKNALEHDSDHPSSD